MLLLPVVGFGAEVVLPSSSFICPVQHLPFLRVHAVSPPDKSVQSRARCSPFPDVREVFPIQGRIQFVVRRTSDAADRRQPIDKRKYRVHNFLGFYFTWPTHKHWHAHASFPEVTLPPTERQPS